MYSRRRVLGWVLSALILLSGSCGGNGEESGVQDVAPDQTHTDVGGDVSDSDRADLRDADDTEEPSGTRVRFDLAAGFFAAPFPIETRRRANGTVNVLDFPNPDANALLASYLQAIDSLAEGFPRNGSIFFPFDGPLDGATLPQTLQESLSADSAVFFLNIDTDSPARGERFPVQVAFHADAGIIRPANLMTVLPYPGFVQQPATLYAAVVLNQVRDRDGRQLEPSPLLAELLAGTAAGVEPGLAAGFSALRDTLVATGIDPARVVAATVYRTGEPTLGARALFRHADALPPADYTIDARIRDYDTYCVLEGHTTLPIYQYGERNYADPGTGHIVFEGGGPVVQWSEQIRFSLSIPKRTMPLGGFPLLFYAAGQGGRYTQVVDRGTFAEQGANPENGRGPAHFLADVGIAALSIEAATVGSRHPSGSFAGLEFFNVFNLDAFRDNIRQAAAEWTVLANIAETMAIDNGETLCPGMVGDNGTIRFDNHHFFFYGHSTGASIGNLVVGLDPAFRAVLLSGTGGSWIYNLALKQKPIAVADTIAAVLELPPEEPLDAFHPMAMLLQMAIEPAEPMNFAPMWIESPNGDNPPKSVLLIEGVVDGYFLPRMVSALAMSARLDLAGPVVDPDLAGDLALVGSGVAGLPAGPNRPAGVSAYVVQFAADGFDGHYVPFELGPPKHTYKCWFDSLLRTGEAWVPVALDDGEAPCPQPQ